jgi:hypothetical protein
MWCTPIAIARGEKCGVPPSLSLEGKMENPLEVQGSYSGLGAHFQPAGILFEAGWEAGVGQGIDESNDRAPLSCKGPGHVYLDPLGAHCEWAAMHCLPAPLCAVRCARQASGGVSFAPKTARFILPAPKPQQAAAKGERHARGPTHPCNTREVCLGILGGFAMCLEGNRVHGTSAHLLFSLKGLCFVLVVLAEN